MQKQTARPNEIDKAIELSQKMPLKELSVAQIKDFIKYRNELSGKKQEFQETLKVIYDSYDTGKSDLTQFRDHPKFQEISAKVVEALNIEVEPFPFFKTEDDFISSSLDLDLDINQIELGIKFFVKAPKAIKSKKKKNKIQ